MTILTDQIASIGGQGVMLDVDATLSSWLDAWLTQDRMASIFVPLSRMQPDSAHSESAVYEPPYPELPRIGVNEYLIPTGLSRYSHGLFLVDKWAMARIAVQAWQGLSTEAANALSRDTLSTLLPQLILDPTEEQTIRWGAQSKAVELAIDLYNTYTEDVYCLRPIRIPFKSRDAWLLPVVDYRYAKQSVVESKTDKGIWDRDNQTTYQEYVDWAWPKLTESPNKTVSASSPFGVPDDTILNSRKPIAVTMDVMSLTIGYRYVPRYGLMKVSDAELARSVQLGSEFIVTGGQSGQCDLPKTITIVGRKVRDWFYGWDWSRLSDDDSIDAYPDTYVRTKTISTQEGDNEAPQGTPLVISSRWSVNIPTWTGSSVDTSPAFHAFVDAFCDEAWLPWLKESLDITYAGIPKLIKDDGGPGDTYFLSGFDDWASIKLCRGDVTTRVRSLPNWWAPKFLIAQDEQDITHEGPAYFVSDANIPKATFLGNNEWKMGHGRAYFMRLVPMGSQQFKLRKTDVYVNVYNTLGSTEAKANWPMQGKFIDGVWCIDVAECV